jgi:peptidoglycan-N-acetylglucosamine deacetylase
MRFFRPAFILKLMFPGALFRLPVQHNIISLTIDDGPDPSSTPEILEILSEKNIKAVFFLSGYKAERYPELVSMIRSQGHVIGNHGYSHLNGLRTKTSDYCSDVLRGKEITGSEIFRPPFGKISGRQFKQLNDNKIVFWDLMPYDFDSTFGKERSLAILKKKIRKGSIIVLHDNSSSCIKNILADFIDFAVGSGYSFTTIF